MAKPSKGKAISIRLSESILEALDARAILDEKDRTQVIREAIKQYLDLPENSLEDRLEVLEAKQNSLDKLPKQLQKESKRIDSMETKIEELHRIMAIILERLK